MVKRKNISLCLDSLYYSKFLLYALVLTSYMAWLLVSRLSIHFSSGAEFLAIGKNDRATERRQSSWRSTVSPSRMAERGRPTGQALSGGEADRVERASGDDEIGQTATSKRSRAERAVEREWR